MSLDDLPKPLECPSSALELRLLLVALSIAELSALNVDKEFSVVGGSLSSSDIRC